MCTGGTSISSPGWCTGRGRRAWPQPATVLQSEAQVTYLCTLEERLRCLEALGPERIGVLTFTRELASLSARAFVALLREVLDMRLLVVGPDMALGRGREGKVDVLASLGVEMGFRVEVVPLLEEGGQKVGSSAVREALARGEMERVAHLLGRPYSLKGPVVRGDSRGKGLGFPTANIAPPPDLALPAHGIYVSRAYVGEVAMPSCTSIGVRPTFAGQTLAVETYILDFEGDLYGQ